VLPLLSAVWSSWCVMRSSLQTVPYSRLLWGRPSGVAVNENKVQVIHLICQNLMQRAGEEPWLYNCNSGWYTIVLEGPPWSSGLIPRGFSPTVSVGSNPACTKFSNWERFSVYLRTVVDPSPNTLHNTLYIVSGFSLPPIKINRLHITEKNFEYGQKS
jgi:hypothetical protein